MNLFKRIYTALTNPQDWVSVEYYECGWSHYAGGEVFANCYYRIVYSERRNEYKLIESGHDYKYHKFRDVVVDRLNALRFGELLETQEEVKPQRAASL